MLKLKSNFLIIFLSLTISSCAAVGIIFPNGGFGPSIFNPSIRTPQATSSPVSTKSPSPVPTGSSFPIGSQDSPIPSFSTAPTLLEKHNGRSVQGNIDLDGPVVITAHAFDKGSSIGDSSSAWNKSGTIFYVSPTITNKQYLIPNTPIGKRIVIFAQDKSLPYLTKAAIFDNFNESDTVTLQLNIDVYTSVIYSIFKLVGSLENTPVNLVTDAVNATPEEKQKIVSLLNEVWYKHKQVAWESSGAYGQIALDSWPIIKNRLGPIL